MRPSFRLIFALVTIVLFTAFGLAYTSTGDSQQGMWHWDRALGGTPGAANALVLRSLDTSPGRGWTKLTEVAVAGSGADRVALLAVRSKRGDVCFAVSAVAFVGEFHCVSNSEVRDEPLLHFESGGGASLGVVDHMTVVGMARSDVARVVVTTASGQHELPVNRAGGFAYDSGANGLVDSISAYRADGSRLAEYRFAV